jgi:ABC-type branched-subunit amino acid transport system substrate-binding protein
MNPAGQSPITISSTYVNSQFPQTSIGVEAGVQVVNAEGGINGHPLKLVGCNLDNGEDTTEAETCARDAVAAGSVAEVGDLVLVTNSYSIFQQAKLPVIGAYVQGSSGLNPALTSPVSYPLNGGSESYLVGSGVLIKQAGYTKVAGAQVQGLNTLDYVQAGMGSQLKIAAEVNIPATATDLSSYAQQLIDAHPDVIFLGAEVPQLASTLINSGYSGKLVTFCATISNQMLTRFPGLECASGSQAPSTPTAAMMQFVAAMRKIGGANVWLGDYAIDGYAAVLALARALKGVPAINSSVVVQRLDKLTLHNGLTPPLSFSMPVSDPITTGATRIFANDITFQVIQNGQLQPLKDNTAWVSLKGNVK